MTSDTGNRDFAVVLWLRNLREAFVFAYNALRVNKIRTGLTTLGMMIGTGSVILVATIALTSRDYVLGQIEAVGSNMIYTVNESSPTVTGANSISDALTLADVDAIRDRVPNLTAVSAIVLGRDPRGARKPVSRSHHHRRQFRFSHHPELARPHRAFF